MKKYSLLIIVLLIASMVFGCASPAPGPSEPPAGENGTDNGSNGIDEPIVSKEIPETFPDELVPLYDVAEIDGVIAVGQDYHQAYYFSNTERTELVEKYREFFKDQDVRLYENEFSYELSGNIDGHKIRMYIMPYNAEDENAVTTNSVLTSPADPNKIENPVEGKYETTVIIFIYKDQNQ